MCLESEGSVCVHVHKCVYMTFENTAVYWALDHWGFMCVCYSYRCVFFTFCVCFCWSCVWLHFRMCVGKWIFAAVCFLCAAYPETCVQHTHAHTHRGATSIISPRSCSHSPPSSVEETSLPVSLLPVSSLSALSTCLSVSVFVLFVSVGSSLS